jgi:hypothetical protein
LSLLLGQAVTEIRHDYPKEDGVKGDPLGIGVATIITLQVLTISNVIIYFPRQLGGFFLGRIDIILTWVLQTRLHRCCAESSTSARVRFSRRHRHYDVSPTLLSIRLHILTQLCTVSN